MAREIEHGFEWIFSQLIYFYHGGLSYTELLNMPIPLIIEFYNNAEKINKEIERQMKKNSGGKNGF